MIGTLSSFQWICVDMPDSYFQSFFGVGWVGTGVLNSSLHICKAGTLLLEPHLQSIFL
jgi:hypothetical protein